MATIFQTKEWRVNEDVSGKISIFHNHSEGNRIAFTNSDISFKIFALEEGIERVKEGKCRKCGKVVLKGLIFKALTRKMT